MRLLQRHIPVRDTQRETLRFRTRAIAGFALIALCLAGLAARFVYLQVARHDEFSGRSEKNRISIRHIAPSRGLIYDRNGVLLADNVAAFRLEVVPEQTDNIERTLDALSDVIAVSEDDIARFKALLKAKHAFESLPLRFRLSEDEIARFSVNRWRFPGVDVVPYLTRSYPRGQEFAHVVGYVGRIDATEEERLDQSRYAGTTHIGKIGIERYYEDQLHGEPGYELIEVNADKRPLRVLPGSKRPVSGENLYLSVDARLQHAAQEAFEGRTGAAVAIDPRNGEVLAMVSVPSFDPNPFVNGISQIDYGALLDSPDKPLLDRAIASGYAPGSTMKPYMAAAGLELGLRRPSDTVLSTGEFHIPGQMRAYRDDKREGHGRVDLTQAIAQSVNTYFYSLAFDMGIQRLSDFMAKFHFGQPSGIDLIGESAGVLPSQEWKRGRFNAPWFPGETVIAGIGQGYWVVTPLQLAQAAAILANKGVRSAPHLLRGTQAALDAPPKLVALPPVEPSIFRNPANWSAVEQGMVAVVNGPTGTARGLGDGFPYLIAGKTGTAERFSRTTETWENIMQVAVERHQVLFEAFAPADDARIAVVVALEAGHTGAHDAAPIARKILDAWLIEDSNRVTGGPS